MKRIFNIGFSKFMFKFNLIVILFTLAGCVHNQTASQFDSKRDPANTVMQTVSFVCERGNGGADKESFQVLSSGEVKYDLLTEGLPMAGRGPIFAQWISQNVVVLSGRWLSDVACGPPSSCQFRYFSIHLHKSGPGLEVTTYFRHPEGTWRSDSQPLNCKLNQ